MRFTVWLSLSIVLLAGCRTSQSGKYSATHAVAHSNTSEIGTSTTNAADVPLRNAASITEPDSEELDPDARILLSANDLIQRSAYRVEVPNSFDPESLSSGFTSLATEPPTPLNQKAPEIELAGKSNPDFHDREHLEPVVSEGLKAAPILTTISDTGNRNVPDSQTWAAMHTAPTTGEVDEAAKGRLVSLIELPEVPDAVELPFESIAPRPVSSKQPGEETPNEVSEIAIAPGDDFREPSSTAGRDPAWPVQQVSAEIVDDAADSVDDPLHHDVSLDAAIRLALEHSTVLGDVGGRLIQSPSVVSTIYGPSVQATDPRFGVEGALSEFDAQFRARAFFEKNDLVLNNEILGGGVNQFRQDLWRFQTELSKKAATGTLFAVRHNVNDDLNNANRNIFARSFDWNTEAEVRHPLLQGAGVRFNRISGRSESPGVANGIMIAQANSKMSIVDFQLALRDYVSNVENAYWDLVLAYRELDAKKAALQRTLGTWQRLKNLAAEGVVNQDKVDQALEQYFRCKEDVENAYHGRLSDGTRTFNGSGGGSLQSGVGVLVAERRLRLIMGLPMISNSVLRPETEPPVASLIYSFDEAAAKAIANRGELELQGMRVAKGKLELEADRNYLLPKLDMVARYRLRGLGDNLYDARVPDAENTFDSIGSKRHEWMVGAEVSYPLGFRQGHSAVRNSQLRIARERAIMAEMRRQLMHDVGNALSNKERAFNVMRAALNRWESAARRYNYLTNEELQAAKKMDFTLILDADRKLAEAESAYHRSCVDYALSLKNLNFEMGTLFGYCNVSIADTAAPKADP